MKYTAAIVFATGILLAVRVMFFGVRRSRGAELVHRAGPLSLAAVLAASGAVLYAYAAMGLAVTTAGIVWVLIVGALAGFGGWWVVRASAAAAASAADPDDDPRYRYQGYVARVTSAIRDDAGAGRIALVVDGQRIELDAKWLPGTMKAAGSVDSEVVIERVDGDMAYVEPWELVEGRL